MVLRLLGFHLAQTQLLAFGFATVIGLNLHCSLCSSHFLEIWLLGFLLLLVLSFQLQIIFLSFYFIKLQIQRQMQPLSWLWFYGLASLLLLLLHHFDFIHSEGQGWEISVQLPLILSFYQRLASKFLVLLLTHFQILNLFYFSQRILFFEQVSYDLWQQQR